MGTFLVILFGVALVTLVGHGLWVAFAAVLRQLAGTEQPPAGEIDIALRQVRALLADRLIGDDVAREVLAALNRQRDGRRVTERLDEAPSPAEELQQWLRGCPDVRELSVLQRSRCLTLLRRLEPADLDRLPAPTLWRLARLVRLAGLVSLALKLYRLLLDQYSDFATRDDRSDEARSFLHEAVRGPLSAEERVTAEALLARLDPPPVSEPPVAPALADEPATSVSASAVVVPVHAAVRPEPVIPIPCVIEPVTPPPPRPTFGEMMAGFMEERNILWGELVGGLLIVGCSIALVVTLWQTLAEVQYFPFLVFSAITAALFGAGKYTFHRWKLHTTSRGLLVISLLLVPLNFLVLAGLAQRAADWLQVLVSVAALGFSTILVRSAGRVVGAPGRDWLALGVVGPAATALLVPPLLTEQSPSWLLFVLACAAVVCQGVAVHRRLRLMPGEEPLDRPRTLALLVFTSLASFAVVVTLGFLLARGVELGLSWRGVAPALAGAAAPFCAVGLIVQRRLRAEAVPGGRANEGRQLDGGLYTLATGVALAGVAALAGSVAVAWPDPVPVLMVCAFNTVLLTLLACRQQSPWAHHFALPCLALAVAVAGQLILGNLPLTGPVPGDVLLGAVTSPSSLATVVALVPILLTTAEWLLRHGWEREGHPLALARNGLVLAGLTLALSVWNGDSAAGTWVSGVCGVTALASSLRWRVPRLGDAGWVLLLASTLGALGVWLPGQYCWWGVVLAAEALLLAVAAVVHSPGRLVEGEGQGEQTSPHWYHSLTASCHWLTHLALAAAVLLTATGFDLAGGPWQPVTPVALLATAALLLAAWVHGRAAVVYLAAMGFWVALAHFFVRDLPTGAVTHPWVISSLVHGTALLVAGLALEWWLPAGSPSAGRSRLGRLLVPPLGHAAQISSALGLVVVTGSLWDQPLTLGLNLLWVATLWLAFAWTRTSSAWFSAFQGLLYVAACCLTTAWIQTQDWFDTGSALQDPRAWQTWGVMLGGLSVAWMAVRSVSHRHERLRDLTEAGWLGVDRTVLAGLVVAQLLVPGGVLLSVLAWEFTPRPVDPAEVPGAVVLLSGWRGWAFAAVLAAALVVALWDRRRDLALVGLVGLALSIPTLLACGAAVDLASASALRWGMAVAFLLCSAVLWGRTPLGRVAKAVGIDANLPWPVADLLRPVMLFVAVTPVLVLTVVVARLGFVGQTPVGPLPGSLFAWIGTVPNNLGPLVLVCVALVGHAVRERSSAYAFWAGQLATATLVGGYALAVVTSGGVIDEVISVRLLQLGTFGAGLWALGWVLVRPWVCNRQETDGPAEWLLSLQLALGLFGVGVSWFPGSWLVTAAALEFWTSPGNALRLGEIGSPLGWLALSLAVVAPVFRQRQAGKAVSWHGIGGAAVAVLALAASDVAAVSPAWGYRTLMLGCAGLALLWSLGQFLDGRASRLSLLPSFPTSRIALPWVQGLALASALLACLAALERNEYLWPAVAVGLASAAGLLLAVWRREEGWVPAWGLGVNLASSLVAWHFLQAYPPGHRLVWLIQTNLCAGSAVALLWLLGQRRWWASLGSFSWAALLFQLGAVVGGLILLLLIPLAVIVLLPDARLSGPVREMGMPSGWATLLFVTAATYAFAARWWPRGRQVVLGVAGLSAGLLAATVADGGTPGWSAYHTLVGTWGLLGGAALGLAVWCRHREQTDFLTSRGLTRWVEVIAVLLLLLAWRGAWVNPLRPWTTCGPALLAVVLIGALAPLWRRHVYVYLSGVGLVLAGLLFWLETGPLTIRGFEWTVAASLALGAFAWLGLGSGALGRIGFDIRSGPVSFPAPATSLAVGVVGVVTLTRWFEHLTAGQAVPLDGLEVPAVASVAAALVLALRERDRFALPGWYALALASGFLAVEQCVGAAVPLWLSSAVALAVFLLVCSGLSWLGRRVGGSMPAGLQADARRPWFTPVQLLLSAAVILPSLWFSTGLGTLAERMTGPFVLGLVVLNGVVMLLPPRSPASRVILRTGTLGAGVLAAVEVGWALLDPSTPAVWLHRAGVVLVAVTAMALAYRWLGAALASAWRGPCRAFGDWLPFVAWAVLPVLLFLEIVGYSPTLKTTALGGVEVGLIAVALVALIALVVRWAVVPESDPLPARRAGDGKPVGRRGYVYGAELLLVCLFMHVRLNVPWLFAGWAGQYWPVLVMGLAFLGVGLGELWRRRGLDVLGDPLTRTGLFLPLLPLLAFWIRPPEFVMGIAEQNSPGLVPMLSYLHKLPQHFDRYAVLWVMLGAVYTLLAVWRRSMAYALFAAAAANVALWSMLGHWDMSPFAHPQMWLIPVAVIVLLAERINRERLRREQSVSLRYGALILIYVSSTADMFIAGLGNSVWLPVALAVLCVLGVFAGILLRVRAYLFVGVGFLCLDVFTMIWHAARDRQQTWVWYVSGIVLGSLILAVFAVFEKRREDVLRMIDRLRAWD